MVGSSLLLCPVDSSSVNASRDTGFPEPWLGVWGGEGQTSHEILHCKSACSASCPLDFLPGLGVSSATAQCCVPHCPVLCHWCWWSCSPRAGPALPEQAGQVGAASFGHFWIHSLWHFPVQLPACSQLPGPGALEQGWGAKGSFFGRYLAVPGGFPGHGIPRRRR